MFLRQSAFLNQSNSIDVKDSKRTKIDSRCFKELLQIESECYSSHARWWQFDISGQQKDTHILIIVKDTGKGIPEEVKSKLFTPMMTTKSKGQGLGLAVSKRFIEAMKGTITFESEKGKGTKFIIELPITQ